MNKILKIAFGFFILNSTVLAQSVDELHYKIDSLQIEKEKFQKQVTILTTELNKIDDSIKKYSSVINRLELNETFNSGFYVKTNNNNATIYNSPSVAGLALTKVNAGDSILVFNWYEKPFCKVKYHDYTGFMSTYYLEDNELLKSLISSRAALQTKGSSLTSIMKNVPVDTSRLNSLTKKYDGNIAWKIIRHEYWIGMTTEMARDSLGSPADINKSIGSWGIHEQWVYSHEVYLYFENDKLTSYQN